MARGGRHCRPCVEKRLHERRRSDLHPGPWIADVLPAAGRWRIGEEMLTPSEVHPIPNQVDWPRTPVTLNGLMIGCFRSQKEPAGCGVGVRVGKQRSARVTFLIKMRGRPSPGRENHRLRALPELYSNREVWRGQTGQRFKPNALAWGSSGTAAIFRPPRNL